MGCELTYVIFSSSTPSPSGFQLLASMTSFAGGQESARAAGEERGTLERERGRVDEMNLCATLPLSRRWACLSVHMVGALVLLDQRWALD